MDLDHLLLQADPVRRTELPTADSAPAQQLYERIVAAPRSRRGGDRAAPRPTVSRRLRLTAVATTALAVAAAAGAGLLRPERTAGTDHATVGTLAAAVNAASTQPTVPGPTTASGTPAQPQPGGAPSAALTAVSLPDPAPGFPLRRFPDATARTTALDGAYWAHDFLLGRTPPDCQPLPPAGDGSCTPTGPEATVIVLGRAKDIRPGADGRLYGASVTGRRTVDNHTAYVTQDGGPALLFATGQFTVIVAGSAGTTVNELVTLADALHGL